MSNTSDCNCGNYFQEKVKNHTKVSFTLPPGVYNLNDWFVAVQSVPNSSVKCTLVWEDKAGREKFVDRIFTAGRTYKNTVNKTITVKGYKKLNFYITCQGPKAWVLREVYLGYKGNAS